MLVTNLIIVAIITTIHLMMASVLALYARHKVQYLALAWIMGIFGVICAMTMPLIHLFNFEHVGLLHPFMLLALVVIIFLQSIYPLSITMPGYLQWERMWKYASPAIYLIILYIVKVLLGSRPLIIHSYTELADCWYRLDMLFRLFGFGLSVYYMVNILRLPRILARHTEIPRYLKGYTSALGLSMLFYVCVVAFFTTTMMMVYVCIFSVVNMYLFYRTLESMALRLPKPEVQEIVDEEPQEKDAVENDETFLDVEDDFNEANCKRFERVEHFMRHQREWKDNTFGRDRLCEATGINRHLLLQCLRSQGYNNCHDYINTYRISALKRGVSAGTITTVNDCVGVGFGSPKTARSCFERMEGISLDDYLKERTGEIVKKNTAVSGLQ